MEMFDTLKEAQVVIEAWRDELTGVQNSGPVECRDFPRLVLTPKAYHLK
jgi:hypothetical protein